MILLKMKLTRLFLSLMTLSSFVNVGYSQNLNTEKTAFINFLKRQYEQEKHEGIRLVEDYDKVYIISVLSLSDKAYPSSNIMFRVAKVKAAQQIGAYMDGTRISSDMLIRSTESGDSIQIEKVEIIREYSNSFTRNVELLTHFSKKDKTDEVAFIYGKEIEIKRKD